MVRVNTASDVEQDLNPVAGILESSSVELDDLDKTLEEAQYALEHPEELKWFTNAKDFMNDLLQN